MQISNRFIKGGEISNGRRNEHTNIDGEAKRFNHAEWKWSNEKVFIVYVFFSIIQQLEAQWNKYEKESKIFSLMLKIYL